MVVHKEVLKRLWTDTCNVYTYSKTFNDTTKRTELSETLLYSNVPCKLSFDSLNTTNETDHVGVKTQIAKLFLDNLVTIPAGSKVVITRGQNTFTYKASGESGIFHNHQEIKLALFDGWA